MNIVKISIFMKSEMADLIISEESLFVLFADFIVEVSVAV